MNTKQRAETVWADVLYGDAPPLPEDLAAGQVERTGPDPARWTLADGVELPAVSAFVHWRRTFVHTMQVGTEEELGVVATWMARKGHRFELAAGKSFDSAAFTSAWWFAVDDVPEHPGLRTVVDRMGAVAAMARNLHAPVRLWAGPHRWPTSEPASASA